MYKVNNHLYLSNVNTIYNYKLMKSHKIKYAIDCTKNSYDMVQLYNIYKMYKLNTSHCDIEDKVCYTRGYKFTIIKYPSSDPHTKQDIKYIKGSIKVMLNRINNYINNGENVLIFCHKGRHRSVTLCILYLMYKYDINYITSYNIMKYIDKNVFSHVGYSTLLLLQYYSNNRHLLRDST